MGMIFYVILSWCFCWIWLWNWLVFELSVCDGLKLLCFRYLWTRVVITMWTPMYDMLVNYLWNVCNMWLVMLNHYDLGCMQVGLKSFVVLVDYWVYMGSSVTIWSLRWLLSYLCSYIGRFCYNYNRRGEGKRKDKIKLSEVCHPHHRVSPAWPCRSWR